MNGFQKRTKAKMDQIEQCAIELLIKPIPEITIAEIAAQAGVSQVTIYNYYGSKEALLKAALKRLFDEQLTHFKDLIDSPLPFDDKLKQIVLIKRIASTKVHSDTYVQLLNADAEMQSFVQHYSHENSIPLFLRFIQEGRACGRLRSNVHDEMLLVYLNMFSHAVSLVTEEEMARMGQPGGLEELIDLFFYGLLNQQNE